MIRFKFNEKKTTQVVAYFLKLNGDSLNYTKLMKLLYLTDRQALLLWNRSLTGDSYVSMPRGPVLSRTYELISYPADAENISFWYKFISTQGYDVTLNDNPGFGTLSEREIKLIAEMDKKYKLFNYKQMINICHRDCLEWNNPGYSSFPLPIEHILKALNINHEERKLIAKEVADLNYINDLFSSTIE
ncbi:MAG: SocA family protein [Nitrospirae bacterium]|nr:SocA family protein [Nitrospirota bacterium]